MKRFIAFFLALGLALLAGCGVAETPVGGSPLAPTPEPEESAARVMVSFETVSDTIERDGAVMLTYSYPSAVVSTGTGSGAKISEAINAALTPPEDKLASLAEAAWAEYSALDEAGRETWPGYGLYYGAEVVRGDAAALCVYCTVSETSGGVHPNSGAFALNFDTSRGERLTADMLGADVNALKAAAAEYILESAADNPNAESFTGLEEFAASALDGDGWYPGDDGLTVFADPMEIAPYAVGEIRFTVPYSELGALMDARWLPEEAGEANGSLSIGEPSGDADCSVVIDEGGRAFELTADGSPGAVRIYRVSMGSDGGTVFGSEALYLSSLEPGERLGVTAAFMDMPLYAVSCASGFTRLIGDSGKDGSLLLLEP